MTLVERDPFWAVAKWIAKRLGGGKIVRVIPEDADWSSWVITLKRPGDVDFASLNAEVREDEAVVYGSLVNYATSKRGKKIVTVREVSVMNAKSIADAIVMRYGEEVRPVLAIVEEQCGIEAIDRMEGRVVIMRTAQAPRHPTVAVRELMAATKGWDCQRTRTAWKAELSRQCFGLWWNA